MAQLAAARIRQSEEAEESPAERRRSQRAHRYYLQRHLMDFTTQKRVRQCGCFRLDPTQPVSLRRESTGDLADPWRAHYVNLRPCGAVWLCPVCAPRIRERRAGELRAALTTWWAEHGKQSIGWLTLTVPHDLEEELPVLVKLLQRATHQLWSGRHYQDWKREFALQHQVRAWDATYGRAGWHPHLHILTLFSRGLTREEGAEFERVVLARWCKIVQRLHRSPALLQGQHFELATRPGQLAWYVAQVAGDPMERSLRMDQELYRQDLKRGRIEGQRTPWELLELAASSPSQDERAWARARWREWEEGSKGLRAITWTRGLRRAVGQAEDQPDEMAAVLADEKAENSERVLAFGADLWREIRDSPAALAGALDQAELGGGLAVWRLLRHHFAGGDLVYWPDQEVSWISPKRAPRRRSVSGSRPPSGRSG